ncbi:MAG: glycosyltransferase [Coriobacteriales bacterium]|nr:glycosyltransferase [Coriobacteriales bacterium]
MALGTMAAGRRPRVTFGTTCRGGGKIYVVLGETDLEGMTLRATARVRGDLPVPARIVGLEDGRHALVLCVLDATQTVVVEALDEQGVCVARATTNVGRHLARLRSMANTLAGHPDIAMVRNCDERPLPGDMELVSCRAVPSGEKGALLHAVFSYPADVCGERDGLDEYGEVDLDVRAFSADGCELSHDRMHVLGSCVAPHMRIPEISCRYVSVSVPAERPDLSDADAPALWARAIGYEGLWRLTPKDGPLVPWARSPQMQDLVDGTPWQGVHVAAIEDTDCVLVSSADDAIEGDVLRQLVTVASCEDVGVAAPRCLFADGTVARGELVVDHLNWRIEQYGELVVPGEPHEVVATCAEPLVMRRSVWDAVGGVSEGAGERAWFADLCLKMRARGLAVMEVPQAAILVGASTRDMGVASANDLMQDVRADAWLKRRWPEVLGLGGSAPADALGEVQVGIRVTKVIRDRDEDIVRGDVEVAGPEADVSGELDLKVRGADENPITSSWVCMGDRANALGEGLAHRVVGFSARIPAAMSEFAIRMTTVGPHPQTQTLRVDGACLDDLRNAWWRQTVVPDQNPAYDEWLRARHRLPRADLALQRELATNLEDPPVFSVIVETEDAPSEEVARTLESVCAQTYAHYELVSDPDAEPQGDFVLGLEPGDVLEPDALFWLAREVRLHPEAELVYGDEDSLLDGRYCLPVLKPDYDQERLRHQDYLGRMVATRVDVTQATVGCHVPRVLLHTAIPCKMGWHRPPEPVWQGPRPLVSIVIPNKDMAPVLERCVRSVLERTAWDNLEVVIVENNSEDAQTFALYERLRRTDERVRVVTCDLEDGFNFSRLCNAGVVQAAGSYVLLLNNDTQVLEADWLDRLMETCSRDEVGCVGARLLYPDNTVQHVGVLVGSHLGPWHANMDVPASDEGYLGMNVVPHRMRAVTGACLLIRRDVWDTVGGMDEGLPVDYNDVDLCLKVGERGLAVVVRPDVTLRHYESVSRGGERSVQAAVGFAHAEGVLRARWGHLVFGEDPSFSPSFCHNSGRFVLDV